MSVLIQKSNIKDEVFGNYTIIPNWLIEKFKYDELAVLTYMLSKPTDWTFNKVDIAKQIGMSREKLNKIFKKFFDIGVIYLGNESLKNTKGQFVKREYHFCISEHISMNGNPLTENHQRKIVTTNTNNSNTNNNKILKKRTKKSSVEKKGKEVVDYNYESELIVLRALNEVSSINTRENNFTALNTIKKIIEGGVSVEDLVGVVKMKYEHWKGSSYEKYLRYQTLFRASKLEVYLDEYSSEVFKKSSKHHLSKVNKLHQENAKKHLNKIESGKTELTKEEIKQSEKIKNKFQKQIEKKLQEKENQRIQNKKKFYESKA